MLGHVQKKIKVAVLMGGPSVEHEVSLKTGRNVVANLDRRSYEVMPVVISKKGEWDISPEELRDQVDIAFIAMHGHYGEDGHVQSELEEVDMPYTGSDAHSSALGMNKFLSLRMLREAGFDVPQTLHFDRSEWLWDPGRVMRETGMLIGLPLVLKPNRGGSSLDTVFVSDELKLERVFSDLFEKHRDLIVQPLIEGREFACGVLDLGHRLSAYPLLPTEIVPQLGEFFDYDSKYKKGGAEEITPARLPDSWILHIRRKSREAHHVLNLRGVSRADYILGNDGNLYILEVNTIPGMTKVSLLPKAAEAMGISFCGLLDRIIDAALASSKH